MKQGTEAWFNARKNKLTGSNIGAALGDNPWRTPDDLIRAMVRDYHGAESEFKGNIATDYGSLHEPLAQMDYETNTGNLVEECGFIVHPQHEWLGASPDGLIGKDGVIEIKCPFGLRNDKEPKFKTAEEQPYYYAQMQIEMACTGRQWCDFYQWNKYGSIVERVPFNQEWFDEKLPLLREFYNRYENELDNPAHLEDLVVEVNTLISEKLLDEYDALSATIDDANARKKEVLAELVEMVEGKNAVICGRKLTKVERKGSIQYAKIVKDMLPDVDTSGYQGKASEYWKLS